MPRSGRSTRGCSSRGVTEYGYATDRQALEAFQTLSRLEGILPALESAHAVAHGLPLARALGPEAVVLLNLSGRGDKDLATVEARLGPR